MVSLTVCTTMNVCRLCGVDLGTNKKNRRSLSRNICRSVLTEVAVTSLETCQSGSRLDTSKFEEGYLCRSCFKDVGKLYKLQLEISNFKETVATKVSEGIHQFAVVYS